MTKRLAYGIVRTWVLPLAGYLAAGDKDRVLERRKASRWLLTLHRTGRLRCTSRLDDRTVFSSARFPLMAAAQARKAQWFCRGCTAGCDGAVCGCYPFIGSVFFGSRLSCYEEFVVHVCLYLTPDCRAARGPFFVALLMSTADALHYASTRWRAGDSDLWLRCEQIVGYCSCGGVWCSCEPCACVRCDRCELTRSCRFDRRASRNARMCFTRYTVGG